MEFKNMYGKFVDIKIPTYTEKEQKLFNKLIEVLFINMYGDAQRSGAIEIGVFNPDNIPSKITMDIALKVSGIYNTKIGVKCLSFFKYLKTKIIYKDLFRKNPTIYRVKGNCRPVYEWLGDIANARHLDYSIWEDVWEYMNE